VERREPASPIGQGGGRRSARQSQTVLYNTIWTVRRANERQLRRRGLLVERLICPGPRAVLEFLEELIRHDVLDEPVVEERFGVYACPNPIIVGDLSADRLPEFPTWLVGAWADDEPKFSPRKADTHRATREQRGGQP
jgi:hypothetical protein